MSPRFSKAYTELLKIGAFPGQVNPWAETRFFHAIHGGMIGHLLEQLQGPLEELGYIAGRETSLTIAERGSTLPDIYVESHPDTPPAARPWNYASRAAEVHVMPGFQVAFYENRQDALFIEKIETGELVTVIELVSPGNKTDPEELQKYRQRREKILRSGVNIVEIDLTRSYTRLLNHPDVEIYPYHVLVYLPEIAPYCIGIDYDTTLPSIAVPLRDEVVPVAIQPAYDSAYQVGRIAGHILKANDYAPGDLPYPTTLNKTQRQSALDKVTAWRAELERLKHNNP